MEQNHPNYPVINRDIDDTNDRPCTIIDIDNMKSEMYAVNYVSDTADIEVDIFVEQLEYGFLELIKLKNELLKWLNNPIELDVGGFVTPTEVGAEIFKADKALQVTFSIELIQEINDNQETELETIEDLDYMYKEVN